MKDFLDFLISAFEETFDEETTIFYIAFVETMMALLILTFGIFSTFSTLNCIFF